MDLYSSADDTGMWISQEKRSRTDNELMGQPITATQTSPSGL